MRIAVYTLTRDRLAYTQIAFASLCAKAGVSFDHYIVDNGSIDGTVEWLKKEYPCRSLRLLPENVGISYASNMALDQILHRGGGYDLICKFDNDCEVVSDNILGQLVEIYTAVGPFAPQYILSPRVEGIVRQPERGRYITLAGRRIGLTAIVGGLFHCVPSAVYARYRYPVQMTLGKGQDDHFCHWAKRLGCDVGYVEGLIVNHYRGTLQQAQDYPDYFERKFKEGA